MASLVPSRFRRTAAGAVCALVLWTPPCLCATPAEEAAATAVVPEINSSRTPIRRVEPTDGAPADRTRPSSLTSSLALLGVMFGGVYVALNWLRRRQNLSPQRAGAVDLLASRRLDAQATLHLVRIGQRVLAVGSSPTGVRTLAVIDDPEEIAVLVSASTTAEPLGLGLLRRTGPGQRTRTRTDGDAQTARVTGHAPDDRSEALA